MNKSQETAAQTWTERGQDTKQKKQGEFWQAPWKNNRDFEKEIEENARKIKSPGENVKKIRVTTPE